MPRASALAYRKDLWQHFTDMGRAVSLPFEPDAFPSPLEKPQVFYKHATSLFARLVTLARVGRGQVAATIFELGALYRSVTIRGKASDDELKPARDALAAGLGVLGIPTAKQRGLMAQVDKFLASERTPELEQTLAVAFGDVIAKTVAAPPGIKVGDATLPNTILLKSGKSLSLPKRLVGYRTELENFLATHPFDRNVFLMMPFRETTAALRSAVRQVCKKYKLHLVIADEQRIIDSDLNGNVLACLIASRYGIAVFAKPEATQTVNPNVAYELGMMHRDDKVCLILKHFRVKHLQTDLVAHLYVDVDPSDKQSVVAAVEGWIQERVLG